MSQTVPPDCPVGNPAAFSVASLYLLEEEIISHLKLQVVHTLLEFTPIVEQIVEPVYTVSIAFISETQIVEISSECQLQFIVDVLRHERRLGRL